MPKSDMGVSAKQRAKGQADTQRRAAEEAEEDASWSDKSKVSKAAAAKDSKAGAAEAARIRKEEDRALAVAEDADMAQISGKGKAGGKKKTGAQPKMTQAMIVQAREAREAKEAKERKKRDKAASGVVDEAEYARMTDQVNRNRLGPDDVSATGIDAALGAVGGDRARVQAAAIVTGSLRDQNQAAKGIMTYKVFEAHRIAELKEEKPGLQGSQYRDLCKKEWKRSPMNPNNQ